MQKDFFTSHVRNHRILFSFVILLLGIGVVLFPDFEFLLALFIPMMISLSFLITSLNTVGNGIDWTNSFLDKILLSIMSPIMISLFGTVWVIYKASPTSSQTMFALVFAIEGIILNTFLATPFTKKYGNREITMNNKRFIKSEGIPFLLLGVGWSFLVILLVGSVFLEPEWSNETLQYTATFSISVFLLVAIFVASRRLTGKQEGR